MMRASALAFWTLRELKLRELKNGWQNCKPKRVARRSRGGGKGRSKDGKGEEGGRQEEGQTAEVPRQGFNTDSNEGLLGGL
jgi:hypothetical protein